MSVRVGADFGDRAAHGFVTDAGLAMFGGSKRALNDTHGLMVYQCDPTPLFIGVGAATARSGLPANRLTAAMESVLSGSGLGSRERIAYHLLSASMSTRSADARFALLMMALESLFEPVPRSSEAQELVDEMIASVRSRGLPPNEEGSIIGSLGWLRMESISQTGRRLAKRLEPRRYNNEAPAKFFTNCYNMRSRLLHGNHPLPDRTDLGARAAPLELFVADVISLLARNPRGV